MKKLIDWDNSGETFTHYVKDGDEIDSDMYTYFLELVPPKFQGNGNFLMGEPYSENEQGKTLYMAFTERDGKFYYLGLATVEEMGG